jgi:hypothetical protein
MSLLDPTGALGPTTPAEPPDQPAAPLETPEHAEEVALAHDAPSVETEVPKPDTPSADLDPALRLQDGVPEWFGDEDDQTRAADEGTPTAEPGTEPYAPLYETDDQGI